jgi:hypothetical protein
MAIYVHKLYLDWEFQLELVDGPNEVHMFVCIGNPQCVVIR